VLAKSGSAEGGSPLPVREVSSPFSSSLPAEGGQAREQEGHGNIEMKLSAS